MKPEELLTLRHEQRAMLANLDDIEQAYLNRPASVAADPELEQWLADSRQAIADQQDWLAQVQQDLQERQAAKRKAQFGIVVLAILLLGIMAFS
ncbi:MAG TPA: hypothetical protein VFV64_15610 [Permianibacter sp.]|nr:hypothetical protein [Permianibacter sp.]